MIPVLDSSPTTGRLAWLNCCLRMLVMLVMLVMPVMLAPLAMLAGCRGEIPLGTVTGHLTIDGRPTPQGVRVVFTPQGADPTPCIGVTNDKGMFVMYHKPGMKGLIAGRYSVSIALSGDEGTGPVMLPPALVGLTIPPEYRPGSSTLTCDVPRSGTVFDINIPTK